MNYFCFIINVGKVIDVYVLDLCGSFFCLMLLMIVFDYEGCYIDLGFNGI